MNVPDHIAVTGASSGVGRACCRMLAQEGFHVLACVRSETDAQDVRSLDPDRISPVMLELQDQETVERTAHLASEITGEGGLTGLVNCAGVLFCGPLEYFPRDQWFAQYDVNVFGTLAVTRALLPLIRKAHGRIVNIGAVGGGVALPFYGAIASSKMALEALNDCLRRELHPFGIHVAIIEPGGIDTPANDKMRSSVRAYLDSLDPVGKERYGQAMEAFSRWADEMHKRNLKPEQVARAVLKALRARRPKTRYRVGLDSRAAALANRLLPDRLFDWIVLRVSRLPVRFGAWKDG